jgi:hypothetical protein
MPPYTLQISTEVQRRLRRCKASLRRSIARCLEEIAQAASIGTRPRRLQAATGPPLRFYVFEGYRVSYVINPLTRKVTVVELQPASA